MANFTEQRCLAEANYIIAENATVRKTAQKFGVSKSTIYVDVTKRVKKLDPVLAREVEKVLKLNKKEMHLRGGIANKCMWDKKKSQNQK